MQNIEVLAPGGLQAVTTQEEEAAEDTVVMEEMEESLARLARREPTEAILLAQVTSDMGLAAEAV